jgi:hypothetical protein
MEVISDHIHELMDLYEWIFNLRAYLASLLAGYVTIGTDQTITGKKVFENLKAHVLNIANATEVLNEGYITTGYYNDSDPALIVHFTAYDDDVPYETRLYLVSKPGGNPYFVIPPTNANDANSAVRLDYLNSVLSTLNDGSTGLADRIAALENKMDAIYPFDSSPTEGSSKGVTSGGVFNAIQTAINNIDFPETVLPVASKLQKGIMQVGDYLLVNDGLVSVDWATIKAYIDGAITAQFNMNASASMYGAICVKDGWYENNVTVHGTQNSSRVNEDVSITNNVSGDVIEPRHIIRNWVVQKYAAISVPNMDDIPGYQGWYIWVNDNYTLTEEDKAAINEFTGVDFSQEPGRYLIQYDSGEVE